MGWGSDYGDTWGGSSGLQSSDNLFESLSISENLTVDLPLRLVGAIALSDTAVRVDFSHPLDPSFVENTLPANYSIPGLSVTNAAIYNSRSVLLTTSEQGYTTYTLTVGTARSTGTDLLVPPKSAVFASYSLVPTFFAAAQSRTKVELVFSQPMLQDADFTDPLNYSIARLSGETVSVVNATASGPDPISRVTLTLGSELEALGHYVARVSSTVLTLAGYAVSPDTSVFQWKEMQAAFRGFELSIPITNFSGEITEADGFILGEPAGQVFFSPSLEVAAPNSLLEVDEVSVCTQAYDVYEFPPQTPDPPVLHTWPGAGVLGTSTGTVLFGPFPRLGAYKHNLSDLREDSFPAAADGPADATLEEPIDILRAGFLNDARWLLTDGLLPLPNAGTYPAAFTTADNLTPIGAGPTTNINLQP